MSRTNVVVRADRDTIKTSIREYEFWLLNKIHNYEEFNSPIERVNLICQ